MEFQSESFLNYYSIKIKLIKFFKVCGVFLVDAQFLVDTPKFFAGVLAALSVMVTLEIPHLNVMTKVDLLDKPDKSDLQKYLEPDIDLINDDKETAFYRKKFHKLNKVLAKVIQDYSLVKFHPLDVSDEDSINEILMTIDNVLQYGEDQDVKELRDVEENAEDESRNFDF